MNLNFYNLKKFKMIKVALFASYLEIHVLTWSNPPIGNVFLKFDLIWPWLTKTLKSQRVDLFGYSVDFLSNTFISKAFWFKNLVLSEKQAQQDIFLYFC
jgi:hypothetical protein